MGDLDERALKTREAKERRAKERAAQTIQIDDHFEVKRFDSLNWQICKDGKPWPRENYYGTLLGAFQALPATMLQDYAKNSMAELLERHRRLCERIETVLHTL